MTERMAVQGLELRFFDDGAENDLHHSCLCAEYLEARQVDLNQCQ